MNACFVVASTYDRIPLLNRCIRNFRNSRYSSCDIYLYFQGNNANEIEGIETFKDVIIDEDLRGVFTPRYEILKRYGRQYDYVIIIDDDLFVLPETDYWAAINFIERYNVGNDKCGCVFLANRRPWKEEQRNRVVEITYPDYCNINGGMVMPAYAVRLVLDYFADKEADYTEDMFWLLLWVKGYDLFLDWRSMASHQPNRKTKNGEFTGYSKVRMEKKYLPILPEYFFDAGKAEASDQKRFPSPVFGIKSLANARPIAFTERKQNKERMRTEDGKKP